MWNFVSSSNLFTYKLSVVLHSPDHLAAVLGTLVGGHTDALLHLQPGVGGLWERGDWSSLDLVRLKDRADSGCDHQDLLSAGLDLNIKYTKTIINTKISMNSF